VFIVVYFVIDSIWKLLDTSSYVVRLCGVRHVARTGTWECIQNFGRKTWVEETTRKIEAYMGGW